MKLLITGAGGFLGKRLVQYYQGEHEIFAATHTKLDFTDQEQVMTVMKEFRPEIVIHCGAVSDVTACSEYPELSYKVNVIGTKNLAAACRKYGAKMIFCSSDQVYIEEWKPELEPGFWRPHKESEELQPLPLYGQQKLAAERLCMQEQPNSVILRLTMLYDVPTDEERQRNKGMFAEHLKKQIKKNAVQAFYTSNYRGITDAREVVQNMRYAMELNPGIYNYGSANDQSMYDTIRNIFMEYGKEKLIASDDSGDQRNLLMDTGKINDAGISFSTTMQGLKRNL